MSNPGTLVQYLTTLSRRHKFWTCGATTFKSSETTALFRFPSNKIYKTDITKETRDETVLKTFIWGLNLQAVDDDERKVLIFTQLVSCPVDSAQFWSVTLFQLEITNLQKIFVQYCKIRLVQPKAFRKLTNLVELDLGENLLQVIWKCVSLIVDWKYHSQSYLFSLG